MKNPRWRCAHVRYWHKADVQTALMNVRYEGNNGHDADVTRVGIAKSYRQTAELSGFIVCLAILLAPRWGEVKEAN